MSEKSEPTVNPLPEAVIRKMVLALRALASEPRMLAVRPIAPGPKLWSVHMEGYGGPVQPANDRAMPDGLAWLKVEYNHCRPERAC
jgi:hypothetical protein